MKSHVCWNITTRCNALCKFCDRVSDRHEIAEDDNLYILRLIASAKVIKKISWTGGEALLYSGLKTMLQESHNLGIENNLITNGLLLTEDRFTELAPYLDYITLSLDSLESKVNAQLGRFENQFEIVAKIVEMIHKSQWNIKIKINTVATKINLQSIENMIDYIAKSNIFRWKIFKFMPLRGAAETKDMFDISDSAFQSLKEIVEAYGDKINTKLFFVDQNEIEEDYLLILANGDFVVTSEYQDKVLFNPITDSVMEIRKLFSE